MRHTNQSLLATISAILLAALFLARAIAITNHYPFYFLWDMDFVTVLDNVLIHSGLTPDHLNHPCFGMYLVQTLSERVAHGLGALSVVNLSQLDASLNPAACMAELTTYVRLHTPFLELGFVLALWAAVRLVLRPGRWLALLFLAALLLQESLAYHASVIRTEMYAMFFWSLAVLLLAIGARARSPRALNIALAGAGVFLGLCFLSKIQALLHLAAFALLALLTLSITDRPDAPLRLGLTRRAAKGFTIAAGANLVIFLLLMLASWTVPIDVTAGGVFVDKNAGFGPNPFALLFLLGGAALAGGQAFLFVKGRTDGLLFRLLTLATLLLSGFLASFLLHFLLFANPGTSLHYLLTVFKMVFLREIESQQQYAYIIINPLGLLAYNQVLFAVHFALLIVLAAGRLYRFIEIRLEQLALCAALTLLTLAMLWLTVRYFLRDLLWAEPVVNVLNIYYFMLIWRGARQRIPHLRAGAVAALVLALLVSAAHVAAMPRRIAMNVNKLGYNVDFWQKGVYQKNHPRYTELMNRHFSWDQWRIARAAATHAPADLEAAQYVFQNQPVTLQHLGPVSEGFPVWSARLDARIAAFPQDLRGAIVVDNAAMPLLGKYFSNDQYVNEHSEYLEKFKPAPGPGILSVLPRNDLRTLLFVQAGDFTRMTGAAPGPDAMKITLAQGGAALDCYGLELKSYMELPVTQLSQDYFFVLKRLYS